MQKYLINYEKFIEYLNVAFLNERKILSKETYKEYKKVSKANYLLIVINAIAYIALLYKFKLSLDFLRFNWKLILSTSFTN